MREGIEADRISQNQATPSQKKERKLFVMPILKAKGWSIFDLAKNAELDFHTVQNYLSGSRKSYASTLKKLADVLGVSVDDLPK